MDPPSIRSPIMHQTVWLNRSIFLCYGLLPGVADFISGPAVVYEYEMVHAILAILCGK